MITLSNGTINGGTGNFFGRTLEQGPIGKEVHGGWRVTITPTGTGAFSLLINDRYNLPYIPNRVIIEALSSEFLQKWECCCAQCERDAICIEYLVARIDEASPFEMQLFKGDGELVLRIGPYGLKGGGKWDAYLFAGAQVALGVVLMGSGAGIGGAMVTSALISSGTVGITYVATTEEEEYDGDQFFRASAYGAMGGLITGAVGHVAREVNLTGRVVVNALGQGAANGCVETVQKLKATGELPERNKLFKKVWVSILGGVAAGLGSAASGELTGRAEETAVDFSGFVSCAFRGGVEGAAAAAATSVAVSTAQGEALEKNFCVSTLIGGGVGAVCAAAQKCDKVMGSAKHRKDDGKAEQIEKNYVREWVRGFVGEKQVKCISKQKRMVGVKPPRAISTLRANSEEEKRYSDELSRCDALIRALQATQLRVRATAPSLEEAQEQLSIRKSTIELEHMIIASRARLENLKGHLHCKGKKKSGQWCTGNGSKKW